MKHAENPGVTPGFLYLNEYHILRNTNVYDGDDATFSAIPLEAASTHHAFTLFGGGTKTREIVEPERLSYARAELYVPLLGFTQLRRAELLSILAPLDGISKQVDERLNERPHRLPGEFLAQRCDGRRGPLRAVPLVIDFAILRECELVLHLRDARYDGQRPSLSRIVAIPRRGACTLKKGLTSSFSQKNLARNAPAAQVWI